jgi:anti-anti-sigma factor
MSDADELPFDVREVRAGEATLLAFEGDLDITAVPEAGAAIERAQSEGGVVTIDLRGLRFIDSSGLRVILEAQRRAAGDGSRLLVVPGDGGVRRVFELSGVAALIEMVDAPPGDG